MVGKYRGHRPFPAMLPEGVLKVVSEGVSVKAFRWGVEDKLGRYTVPKKPSMSVRGTSTR